MRKGKNPAKLKDKIKVKQDCFHQVIIPVYLPELEGYYKQGLEILKFCIDSIYLTTHDKTFISVINNGSCKAVREYLNECLEDEKIQEIIHTSTIGKVNAISKGLSGHDFDLVTITDADVLFINGWQKAVYEIYETFPKAGMVGTTPNPLGDKYLTENIYYDNAFKKSINKIKPSSIKDIELFYSSIDKGTDNLSNILLKIIEKNNVIGVIGAGHFCATYKKECLYKFKKNSCVFVKMGGEIMKEFIDDPISKLDFWRLSSLKNYTYHLGNVTEEWMTGKFKSIKKNEKNIQLTLPNSRFNESSFKKKMKYLITRKLLFKTIYKKLD